jgi:dolichol-phosphate mannosyltransferase
LILLSLGIVAEYIWRIHEEVKGRPGFVIREAEDDGSPDDDPETGTS